MATNDSTGGIEPFAYPTLAVAEAQAQLHLLCDRVSSQKIRVHVTDTTGCCSCVLLSKVELDTLEKALELLGNSDHVQAMHATLSRFAISTTTS